jgi:hypothetical protein
MMKQQTGYCSKPKGEKGGDQLQSQDHPICFYLISAVRIITLTLALAGGLMAL